MLNQCSETCPKKQLKSVTMKIVDEKLLDVVGIVIFLDETNIHAQNEIHGFLG